eukprot:365744-Chlamydomonas_euryale.AAC.7
MSATSLGSGPRLYLHEFEKIIGGTIHEKPVQSPTNPAACQSPDGYAATAICVYCRTGETSPSPLKRIGEHAGKGTRGDAMRRIPSSAF